MERTYDHANYRFEMKITNIQKQIKTEGRYSIFVDEKFSFGISELGLMNSGIRVGLELDDEELARLKDEANTDKYYNMTLGLIARRQRSEWEIREYLKRKELAPFKIDEIVVRLAGRGYVDDAAFARSWVSNRRLLKNMSGRKLTLELRTKRIADAVIREVMLEDETDEREVLRAEIIKKRKQTRYQDDQKLMQYLARQGYSYDDIKSVLAES